MINIYLRKKINGLTWLRKICLWTYLTISVEIRGMIRFSKVLNAGLKMLDRVITGAVN